MHADTLNFKLHMVIILFSDLPSWFEWLSMPCSFTFFVSSLIVRQFYLLELNGCWFCTVSYFVSLRFSLSCGMHRKKKQLWSHDIFFAIYCYCWWKVRHVKKKSVVVTKMTKKNILLSESERERENVLPLSIKNELRAWLTTPVFSECPLSKSLLAESLIMWFNLSLLIVFTCWPISLSVVTSHERVQ